MSDLPAIRPPILPLSDAVLSFIASCGSIRLASRTAAFRPIAARGLSVVVADRSSGLLRVCVSTPGCRPLLEAVQDSGTLAVALSQPLTHRSLQIKGRDAVLTGIQPEDRDQIDRLRRIMALDLRELGYDTSLTDSFWKAAEDPLTGITFTAAALFDQTPGPAAGSAIDGRTGPSLP
ncbi:hypothetical protein [Novispirillum itersonii]|uniref:Pyridoxamine 5'-phosphate oxidase n=1 Tax=Novispirillum itersonii TaxID=189 RepID=A0A7W9ZH94_NOVIT|nr:hypothetical protein [Novispirillum itersonii]MBB6211420.1 hypothetical protein [Novispirillum itersonii]